MKNQVYKFLVILLVLGVANPLSSQQSSTKQLNELLFIVTQENHTGIINSKEQVIIPIEYNSIEPSSHHNSIVIASKQKQNSNDVKMGAINLHNQVIIPFEFDRLNKRKNTNRILGQYKSKKGQKVQKVFDSTGSEVFPSEIKNVWYFTDTVAKIKEENFEYLINTKGERITRKYTEIYELVNGMIKFRDGDLSGFLDSTYAEVIPAQYDWFATGFFKKNGLANVRLADQWTEAEIKKDGSEVFNIGINYRYLAHYRKGDFLLAYEVDPSGENSSFEHCLFDFNTGKMIYNFGPSMEGAGYKVFEDKISFWGRPMYQDYYELTVIDRIGNLIRKTQIPMIENYTHDALIFFDKDKEKDRYGIIPMDASLQVEMRFDSIYRIRKYEDGSDVIIAIKDQKLGVIDNTGSTILDFKYDKIDRIKSGDLTVFSNGENSLFLVNGDEILSNCKYPIIQSIEGDSNLYVVEANHKYGVYNFKTDTWILKPEYSNIKPLYFSLGR
ncbi:MAG: WG repeat-containing protein [Bacteroidota bacterium]